MTMEKRQLLDRIASGDEEHVMLGGVMDKYEQCRRRNVPVCTAFLSPQQQMAVRRLLSALGAAEETFIFWGGYEGAERCQVHFLPDWQSEPERSEIVCLRAAFYQENAISHRDVLGSLMGMGLTRRSIGDILMTPRSAEVFVSAAVAEHLLDAWDSAGRTPLHVTLAAPEEIVIAPPKTKELRDTVSSLRLDSVLAVGFSLARGKATEAVERGHVQLNWTECVKPDKQVAQGDVISVRSLGKCRLTQVGQTTKKGRIFITVERYI